MIPKIIHQTTNSFTWEELNLVSKAKKMMPDFQHVLWNDGQNDALLEKHFPQHMDEYRNLSQGVMRVDIARCLYLLEQGGIYCDTDYRFYKPLDAEFLSHRCVLGIEEHENANCGGYKAGNAFMASEAGFELWPEFVDSIFYRHRQGERDIVQVGGPHALTKFIKTRKDLEAKITLLPPEVLYPPFANFKLTTYRDDSTIGAHLCWGSWRNKGVVQMFKCRARRLVSAALA